MLHTVPTVSSGHTSTSFFSFKPSHPSSSSFTFYMDQPNLLPFKLKNSHQHHLTCQASSHQHVVANAAPSNMNPVTVAPRVGIIMDSDSDLSVMKSAAEILEMFGVSHEVQTVSAHRTPELMFSYASSARERGIQVIIAGAGGAAHLPGMVAAITPLPVIGVPVRGSSLDGLDSLLSIVQMPRGVPVATVAIDNVTNAGLLAVRMLGVANDNLLSRMIQYQKDQKDSVLKKGDKIENAVVTKMKPVIGAPRVGIIMGSDSDLPVMKSAAEILKMFGVPHEVRIVSAHRTPELMFSYASSAHERGIQVIIAGAGGAAHLPGMVAAITPLPVIGVPVRGSSLDGIDSLLSIVQMPPGAPVATVAVNNATNAGLLAVRTLGVADDNFLSRMSQYQEDQKDSVLKKGDKLEKLGWESYLNS